MPDRLRVRTFGLPADRLTFFPMPSRRFPSRTPATVLAFDFGEKRIGVAVGDLLLRIPHPLATIATADNRRRFAAIAALLEEWRPALLVVGLPLRSDGTEHEMTRRCRRFANQLRGRFGLPVEMVDERLTSTAAAALLGESGVAVRRRRPALDPVAAQQILLGYFETARVLPS